MAVGKPPLRSAPRPSGARPVCGLRQVRARAGSGLREAPQFRSKTLGIEGFETTHRHSKVGAETVFAATSFPLTAVESANFLLAFASGAPERVVSEFAMAAGPTRGLFCGGLRVLSLFGGHSSASGLATRAPWGRCSAWLNDVERRSSARLPSGLPPEVPASMNVEGASSGDASPFVNKLALDGERVTDSSAHRESVMWKLVRSGGLVCRR